ncbi:hypothetical protein EDM80_14055 [bacterium]|nr:MAG: hypothetical protein EDM80_14055 [bacterium]MBV6517377.1 hypothetical protein [Planctomycetota bacterium]NUO15963.1 hypothetical protein [Planctomycetaceae bacterium]MCQ3951398.1 hypothetical protein [Planctomycetota bacterium]RIK63214.1 MAG: hypothetical protein DCC64_07940 [Planctomycetota bacterium]
MSAKKRPDEKAQDQQVSPGLVTAMFDRVRLIKRKHPDTSRRIDTHESEIREKLMQIKDAIDEFPAMEKELITVLVINGIHKMCDEILIDSDEESEG